MSLLGLVFLFIFSLRAPARRGVPFWIARKEPKSDSRGLAPLRIPRGKGQAHAPAVKRRIPNEFLLLGLEGDGVCLMLG